MIILSFSSCKQKNDDVCDVLEEAEVKSKVKMSNEDLPFYYYGEKGKKEFLKIRKDKMIVKTNSKSEAKELSINDFFIFAYNIGDFVIATIDSLQIEIKEITKRSDMVNSAYAFEYADGTLLYPTNQIYVIFKEGHTPESVFSTLELSENITDIELYDQFRNGFIITVNIKLDDIFSLSRFLYESEFCICAEPLPLIEMQLNNTYYNDQWGLKNFGQSGGVYGIDIKAEQAWAITKGNANIKIAVIDDGVELTHYDLHPNIVSGYGYDAVPAYTSPGGSYGGPFIHVSANNGHGTCCAGIIGAVDNTIGVVGVASSCKIMPIRISYTSIGATLPASNYAWQADAINHAWQNGADVISCSWSASSHTLVTNAINDAVKYGRNGKGCVVVCSSGNNASTSVNYPANLPNVIAVGAIDRYGTRASYSNYGNDLNVVAPGVVIYTTDISGTPGYNTSAGSAGDYNSSFGGTSAACPHVAGVAALILSVKPDLTSSQVCSAIEASCTKLNSYSFTTNSSHPNGTWSTQVGHGLVNANAALNKAIGASLTPSTSNKLLCSGSNFSITLNNPPASYSWAHSSNVTLSGSGNTRTVTGTTNSGAGWVSVRVGNGDVARYDFWVQTPVISAIDGPSSTPSYQTATYRAIYNLDSSPTNSWQWSMSPPSSSYISPYGKDADIYFYPGDYQITVRVSNACGVGDYRSTRVYVY